MDTNIFESQNIKSIEDRNRLHSFTLDSFARSVDGMIATSENAYHRTYDINIPRRVKDYTPEEVQRIIERGTNATQQELSYNYFLIDGFYRRIIIYYATFLKYCGILIPIGKNGNKIIEKSNQKRYNRALDFLGNTDIQNLSIDFATKALVYGTYYGVIQTLDKENFTILDLPSQYCYSRYKDLKNNDIIEFDLHYFDTLQEGEMRDQALAVYPQEFRLAYKAYRKNATKRYFRVPSEIGICFPFYDGKPFFLSMIPEIITYREYEVMEKEKDKEEIKKILIQKIPHLNEGTLLFEPPEAEVIHRGSVDMLKNNKNISVLTTYADVDVAGTGSSNETVSKNNLEKIAQCVYRSAGVSAQLFAATGNMALTSSIQNDLALMMSLATKISRFLTNIVNRLYGNSQITFKYSFLPVSYYNEKEYLDQAYKGATSGYSFLLPSIAMGIDQRDIINIKMVENDIMKLGDYLIPLKTSYTDSANEGGRPEKADTEKTDKTIKNIESAE